MPVVANRNRFLPVCITMPGGREVFWGPRPKVWPLTGRERRPPMPVDAFYGGRHVSPVGNRFHREDFGDDALPLFRVWLAISLGILDPALPDWPSICHRHGIAGVDDPRARSILARAVPNDPAVMRWMRSVQESSLIVCSCAPAPCHMDVVLSAWQYLKLSGALDLHESPESPTLKPGAPR